MTFYLVYFHRYCTEVLALLPFISLDEPLYLIYAINRVVQVRVGQLEANFKAWSSSLLRSAVHGTNGMHQRWPDEPNPTTQMMSMDLNGTFQENLDVAPNFNDMTSMDLNGTDHQLPDYPLSHNGSSEVKPHDAGFSDSSTFSNTDLEKVQVFWNLQSSFLSIILICL